VIPITCPQWFQALCGVRYRPTIRAKSTIVAPRDQMHRPRARRRPSHGPGGAAARTKKRSGHVRSEYERRIHCQRFTIDPDVDRPRPPSNLES